MSKIVLKKYIHDWKDMIVFLYSYVMEQRTLHNIFSALGKLLHKFKIFSLKEEKTQRNETSEIRAFLTFANLCPFYARR